MKEKEREVAVFVIYKKYREREVAVFVIYEMQGKGG